MPCKSPPGVLRESISVPKGLLQGVSVAATLLLL